MRTIAVVVQACEAPGRPGWSDVQASIEASDIGKNYLLRFHPPKVSIPEHMYASLRAAAAIGAEFVLRLEDDVEVGRHILQNLQTWTAVDDPRFGLGWAFDPAGITRSRRGRRGQDQWVTRILAYSQAVLMRSADVEWIIAGCQYWYRNNPKDPGLASQDLALSDAVLRAGKQIVVHAPSLVEHRVDLSSQLGHNHPIRSGTSRGSFDKDWLRGRPVYDRYGRLLQQRS